MSLDRLIEKEFGFPTTATPNPVTTSVAVTKTQILRNNPDRLGFLIINLGANPIYVTPDSEPSTTRGILLAASGGFLTMLGKEDGAVVGFEFWGIASGGASAIFSLETEGL